LRGDSVDINLTFYFGTRRIKNLHDSSQKIAAIRRKIIDTLSELSRDGSFLVFVQADLNSRELNNEKRKQRVE